MLGLSIPLFNEEALVWAVVGEIRAALASTPHALVLVNNGSTDETGAIVDDLASQPGVTALHLTENAGYGGGILAGLAALLALPAPPDVLGWCWGDGQIDPVILPTLLRACRQGADLAKAERIERRDGLQRRIISGIYARAMAARGVTTPDVNGCPKLLTRQALAALELSSTDWFLDAEAIIKAEAMGLRIASASAVMLPRAGGRSKVNWRTVAEFVSHLLLQ